MTLLCKKKYIKCLFDDILEFTLKSKGAIVTIGLKWCGKSTTASRYAKTIIDLMPQDTKHEYIQLAKVASNEFLNIGQKPILIDEWQHISFLWDQIKNEVDKTDDFSQYLLIGSVSNKENNKTLENESRHTGNGRIVKKIMKTMSLYETRESNEKVSLLVLKNLFFYK